MDISTFPQVKHPPADLPNPEIEPGSPALQADSLPAELSGKCFIISKNDFKTLSF